MHNVADPCFCCSRLLLCRHSSTTEPTHLGGGTASGGGESSVRQHRVGSQRSPNRRHDLVPLLGLVCRGQRLVLPIRHVLHDRAHAVQERSRSPHPQLALLDSVGPRVHRRDSLPTIFLGTLLELGIAATLPLLRTQRNALRSCRSLCVA